MEGRILFVDDDEDDEELIRACMEQIGFSNFEFCPHPQAALDYLVKLENPSLPDLIVAELYLPSFEGVAFIKELRNEKRYDGIMIALYAGSLSNDVQEHLKALGIDAFFNKPTNLEELGYLVNRLVELSTEHYRRLTHKV